MTTEAPSERDMELADQAVEFVMWSEPGERIANVALLFKLARLEGRSDVLGELKSEVAQRQGSSLTPYSL